MTEIGPKRFRLLFRGQLSGDTSPGTARAALARELSLSEKQVDACFSGRKVALRSQMEADAARQLHRTLSQAGLVLSIDPPLPDAAATPAPQPQPEQPGAPTRCPRCQGSSPAGGLCRPCRAARRRSGLRWLLGLAGSGALAAAAAWAWFNHGAPYLHEYQSRQHLAHALSRVEDAQQSIIALYDKTGFLPNTNLDAKLPPPAAFADHVVAGVRVGSSGQITLSLQPGLPLIGGDTLIFVPERHDSDILRWRCEAGTLPAQRRPQRCQHKLVLAADQPEAARPLTLEDITRKLPATSGDPLARRKAVAQAEISDIIADSKGTRVKMMAYYVGSGAEWPATNGHVDLPEPHRMGGGNLTYVKVLRDGRIEYRFNGNTAGLEGHKFWLKATPLGQWLCVSTLPDDHLPPACDGPIL